MEYIEQSQLNFDEARARLNQSHEQKSQDFINHHKEFLKDYDVSKLGGIINNTLNLCDEFYYDENIALGDLSRIIRGENPYDFFYKKEDTLTSKFFAKFRKNKSLSENIDYFNENISNVVQRYKKYEDEILKKGNALRQENKFKPHDFFEGGDKKIFNITPLQSSSVGLSYILHYLNENIKGDKQLSIVKKEGKDFISYGGNHMKMVSFFERKEKVLSTLAETKVDYNDKPLFNALLRGDFKNYKSFLRARKENSKDKEITNKEFSKVLEDEFLFNHLSFELSEVQKIDEKAFKDTLQRVVKIYGETSSKLEQESAKKLDLSEEITIDTLIFTQNPVDIARMSNYSGIESCMSPYERTKNNDGKRDKKDDDNHEPTENYKNLYKEIGEGTIVVFGIDSKNPFNKLCRVSLKPYENDKGETTYKVGKAYGKNVSGFHDIVSKITNESVNKNASKGLYKLKNVYADTLPNIISNDDEKHDFKDILKLTGKEYEVEDNGNLYIKSDFDFSDIGIGMNNISFKETVEIDGIAHFRGKKDLVKFPDNIKANQGYYVFGCSNLRYIPSNIPDDMFHDYKPHVIQKYKENWDREFNKNNKLPNNVGKGR
ncbi:MAG: hypothetical protein BWY78_00131 [Alphaproteobacteria bacterium ADurb.Bin438]|nr:MAG: hypothetical protein BWY78_00131 [Alphaproteobacteria bacterium ADurb.Bin438]